MPVRYSPGLAKSLTQLCSGAHEQEITSRAKFLSAHSDIVVPKLVYMTFILPADEECISVKKKLVDRKCGTQASTLKLNALALLSDKKQIHALAKITNPKDKRSPLIILFLLEIAYAISTDCFENNYLLAIRDDLLTSADNFGLWQIRYVLEDEIFQRTDPENFELVQSLLEKQDRLHKEIFGDVTKIIRHHLKLERIENFEIENRKKNAYGIYIKMKTKHRNINHITDLFAFRIIVDKKTDCYSILELIHQLWPPYYDRFKDYIKDPKQNYYQSIHTTLQCLNKVPVEFQIRTREMDFMAKHGVAGHSAYKRESRKS